MLMEYATRNGFGNCQYYVDDGYSGTNSDRPAFQELLDEIRDGKVATVITKDYCAIIGLNQKDLENQGILA
jgi:DNA invertase Pin-like site-specific DNA recombinase